MHVVRTANLGFQIELQQISRDSVTLNGMHHDTPRRFNNMIVSAKFHAVSIHTLRSLNGTCITNK